MIAARARRTTAAHARRVRPRPKAGRYHHGRLKEALIRAGRALLEERGLHRFTLRECARRARVSHAAPAHHFGSVDDLLAEIAAQGFDELGAAMDAAAAHGHDGAVQRLVAIGRGYVGFALANKAVFRLMFDGDADRDRNERLGRAAKAAYGRLIDGIANVIPQGSSPARQAMADLAWAGVHGFAMLALGGEFDRAGPDHAAFERRLSGLLDGIAVAVVSR
jgi:AcrR family transcriptional regulator